MIAYHYDDGGRKDAGYKGKTGDCVVRSIAIATQQPYAMVYDRINELAKAMERPTLTRSGKRSSARAGVHKNVYGRYLREQGWVWVPCMAIGSGCKVHLRAEELPAGRLIVRVTRHMVAVIDGVVHDTYDCSRDGDRCVYGYWSKGD
jgi:hypothetical protein